MKTVKFLVFVALALGMGMACSGDVTPGQGTGEIERHVADFNLPADCGINYAKMQHDSVYVINSEAEWANIFICESSPEIDFSKYSLLSVHGYTTSGITKISKKLSESETGYVLEMEIGLDDTAVVERWLVAFIINKLYPGSSIELKVSANNGEEFTNPYRETIIGKWKLQNVAYAYDYEEKKLVEFKDSPVLYEFKDSNKLTVIGDESVLPDDILIPEGEHSYEYHKLHVGILAFPGPNFRIDQGEAIFCSAFKNDNKLTMGGEILDRQLRKVFRWQKTFIEQN
jgi:hypothetical protein